MVKRETQQKKVEAQSIYPYRIIQGRGSLNVERRDVKSRVGGGSYPSPGVCGANEFVHLC